MNATSWIFRRLTQNEFKAINDQIQSEGGGSQTYIDLPKGKISDDDLNAFFGEGNPMEKGYKWVVPIYSLSLDLPPQEINVSQRRSSSNCIREQNKEKRINAWKSEYSDFPASSYNEAEDPIYIFIFKSVEDKFYAGWFYVNEYKDNWFITKTLCKPLFGESCGYSKFETPIVIDINNIHWPFQSLSIATSDLIKRLNNKPLQLIYYGAPGTGKSFTIDKETNENNSVRTTFHPDSDYAGFVGAYKPTMKHVPITVSGVDINGVGYAKFVKKDEGKHPGTEEKIVYKYVPQAFLKAYVEAWKRYKKGEDNPYYLVIEEINRGNCAQIFGDLFQLLDRNNVGSSSYAISADEDIAQFLRDDKRGFAQREEGAPEGLTPGQRKEIEDFVLEKDSGEREHIGSSILDGSKLLLPPNLRIWATMNTSDQSLFPIDSAFKRRWNWEYMPIEYTPIDKYTNEEISWKLKVGDKHYSWGKFLEIINKEIESVTVSEDKQMGYFFAKPDIKSEEGLTKNDTISTKVFVNKVLFYLWTDVFKDYDLAKEPFIYKTKDKEGNEVNKPFTFRNFFPIEKNICLADFMQNLEKLGLKPLDEDSSDNTTNTEKATKRGNGRKLIVKFSDGSQINGATQFDTYLQALEKIGLDKAMEVIDKKGFSRNKTPLITKERFDAIEKSPTYSYVQKGDYYIIKGIDTMDTTLKAISDELNLNMEVYFE